MIVHGKTAMIQRIAGYCIAQYHVADKWELSMMPLAAYQIVSALSRRRRRGNRSVAERAANIGQ